MLYDIAFFIFSIFYLPTLIFKGKLHKDFLERFGIFDNDKARMLASGRGVIWIQAVSVGEVALLRKFIPMVKKEFPSDRIVLSTITKTGNELAKKLYSNDATIIYFPLDFSFIVKKVAGMINPKLYIMVETEIWPNLINELFRSSVPSVVINGRISDRSYGKYKAVKGFLKSTLQKIKCFCMQSETDAERIKELGAPPSRVRITGNMKFDFDVPIEEKMLTELKNAIGVNGRDMLIVAGSTHHGEEEALAAAYRELLPKFPGLRLLIAPRHIERVNTILSELKRLGIEASRVSSGSASGVLILDTIGRLNYAYSLATVVFVGGSLIRHGGQNPIEPAVFSKPILFGPYMFNFRDVAKLLVSSGGAVQLPGREDLSLVLSMLLSSPAERARLGGNAKKAVTENRGATERNLETILEAAR